MGRVARRLEEPIEPPCEANHVRTSRAMLECGVLQLCSFMSCACRRRQTTYPLALGTEIQNVAPMLSTSRIPLFIATLLLAAGCSKEPTPASAPSPPLPLVERSAADPVPASTEELRGSFAPGGIAATYRASFKEGKIQSLEETRQASSRTGAYEFLGARLMSYRGAALDSNDSIELQFDEQGKVLQARAGNRALSAAEISAVRDRAQSLLSHAVSQYGVKGHEQVSIPPQR